MTQTEYRKMTEAVMKSKRWRTTAAIETKGGLRIAAGVEVKIVAKFGGVAIESPECQHCGVRFRCRKIHPSAVMEILG